MRIHGAGLRFTLLLSILTIVMSNVPAADTAESSTVPEPSIVVEVSASRLDDQDLPREEIPASITVIPRERIEASGARNLQDLLSREAGVLVYDQVGNDVQKTFDLRGFTSGTGTAVILDGVRLNDPRNNTTALENIPLDAVERIEVIRGSAAALAGGGSEAGTVRITTRRSTGPEAALTLAGGSDGALRVGAEAGGRTGRFDGFISAASDDTDGFRTNSDGKQKRWSGTGGVDLGNGRRLALSVGYSALNFGNPGALTEDELATRPESADYNLVDFTDSQQQTAVLNYRGGLDQAWSLAANLSWTGLDATSLTTGRAAAAGFGGFFLDSDGSTLGSNVQLTHNVTSASGAGNQVVMGAEWLDGETDSLAWFTDPADPASFDRSTPASDNIAKRTAIAVFVHDTWRPSPRWSLAAGARYDDDQIEYREHVPDPTLNDSKSFSEVSLRAGAVFHPTSRFDVFASYGESFLPPTVEELFAFPLFGSNPELKPEDAKTAEVGVRSRANSLGIEATLFRVATKDEIVFDFNAAPFGMNVNAGSTLRTGAEIAVDGHTSERFRWFARYTRTDAEFRSGDAKGNQVPLVPEDRATAGFDLLLPAHLTWRADALYSGSQVLDNDDANQQPRLDAYTVVNTRLEWRPGGLGLPTLGGASDRTGITFFVEVRNLFDESYATRGIFAFDFLANSSAVFLTPAPGRRVFGGATWRL